MLYENEKSLNILAEYLILMQLFSIHLMEFQILRFFVKIPLNVTSGTSKTIKISRLLK